MFCRHCGKRLPDDSKFCTYCGKSVVIEDEGASAGRAPEPDPVEAVTAPAADDALAGEVAAQATPDSPVASSADTAAAAERPAAAADMPAAGATQPAAWTVPADAAPPPDASAPVTPPAAAGPSPRRRAPIAIAAVVAAVVVIAIAAGFAWQRAEAERAEAERAEQRAEREREEERARQEALTSVHAVAIEVDARGWDTGDGASPLPVEVTGTEAAGDEVDEVQFVDSDGDGLELRAGDYELRVACSPIADDGTMYDAPSRAVELSIDEDLVAGRDLDRSDEVSFELDALRSGVSSADIERAYDYAVDAGCDDADDLRDAARERYLDADDGADDDASASDGSDSSSGSSSSRGNAVSSMYEDEFLTMAVPDGWEINLASGGGDVFARYTVSLAGEQLFTIDVHTGSVSVTNTDITDLSGVVILGTTSDGMAVTATRGNGDAAYNNMANIANCLDTVRVK